MLQFDAMLQRSKLRLIRQSRRQQEPLALLRFRVHESAMPRVDLSVPFEEKDEAKRLGARWDATARVWFVPDGVDAAPFAAWTHNPFATINTRCNRFFIAEAQVRCAACSADTPMFTFLLPQGHDLLRPVGEEHEGRWMRHEYEVFLWRVTLLDDAAHESMAKHSAGYAPGPPREGFLRGHHFNRCARCAEILTEPGSGGGHVFQPECHDDARRIRLHYYNKPFAASCHLHDEQASMHFHDMRKFEGDDVTSLVASPTDALWSSVSVGNECFGGGFQHGVLLAESPSGFEGVNQHQHEDDHQHGSPVE
ncbi:MAG TPA: DUF5710 domain-containing protein [Steroidobacteraceae bacterium]|nr:DUF5710 domain-containing protein [Steroidobacteraceae bacterium]